MTTAPSMSSACHRSGVQESYGCAIERDPSTAAETERQRVADELYVLGDAEVRQDRIPYHAPAVDQEGGAPDADAQQTVDLIHLHDCLVGVRQQGVGEGVFLAKGSVP